MELGTVVAVPPKTGGRGSGDEVLGGIIVWVFVVVIGGAATVSTFLEDRIEYMAAVAAAPAPALTAAITATVVFDIVRIFRGLHGCVE